MKVGGEKAPRKRLAYYKGQLWGEETVLCFEVRT